MQPWALKFRTSFLGNRNKEAIEEFWNHCLGLPQWQNHPVFLDGSVPKGSAYVDLRIKSKFVKQSIIF